MDLFDVLAIVLTLTAEFSYLNYRFIRLITRHHRRDGHCCML
ncbi:MAG: hypothetical protein OXI53_01425 [Nitrospira sp.]|nr:hypothetical protein [Nitrospira sp.]MDE0487263.1 hypothetical protein [Nitrospira sp.]